MRSDETIVDKFILNLIIEFYSERSLRKGLEGKRVGKFYIRA